MTENPRFKITFAANTDGRFTWSNPDITDQDFSMPVLLGRMQKGILTVTDTIQTEPFIRDHGKGLRALHLPDGFAALAFLLDRDQSFKVRINPRNPGSSYTHQIFYNERYPITKTAHLAIGTLPFALSIEGWYDSKLVNWRREITSSGLNEFQSTTT